MEITMSISSAPSMIAMAVSATFTSIKVCEEGNPADTQAIFTSSTSNVSFTTSAKLGYTQIAATFFKSGNSSSNWFTFSVNFMTLSSLSVLLRVVRSMQLNRNFFTSGVLLAGTFSAIILATSAAISASFRLVLYFAKAASYLLWVDSLFSMVR